MDCWHRRLSAQKKGHIAQIETKRRGYHRRQCRPFGKTEAYGYPRDALAQLLDADPLGVRHARRALRYDGEQNNTFV
jgi:hypothetical protein